MALPLLFDRNQNLKAGLSEAQDPADFSAKLAQYQILLYTKPLPSGGFLKLRANKFNQVEAELPSGESILLTSMPLIHQACFEADNHELLSKLPQSQVDIMLRTLVTSGNYMLIPAQPLNGYRLDDFRKNPRIGNRIDLYLECVRRQYAGEPSPLDDILNPFKPWFELFLSFKQFVEFFYLGNLYDPKLKKIHFFKTFDPDFPINLDPETGSSSMLVLSHSVIFAGSRGQAQEKWLIEQHPGAESFYRSVS